MQALKLSIWAFAYPRAMQEGSQAVQAMAKMHLAKYRNIFMDWWSNP